MPLVAGAGCQQELNIWCDQNCVHSASHGPLIALHGLAAQDTAPAAWRCYAPKTLRDGVYHSGTEYCTRHAGLYQLLRECEASPPPTVAATVHALGATAAAAPDVVAVGALPPWTTNHEVTLPAIDTRDFRPAAGSELLKVHGWTVDCIDSIKLHKLRNRTGNVSARNAFLSRDGLKCHGRCVRGVVDGFATHDEIAEMLTIAPIPRSGQPSDIKQWRWEPPDEPAIYGTLVGRAQAVLEEQFGIRHLRFYRSNMITWHGQHHDARERWPTYWRPRKWIPSSLHGDTNTDEMFLFTTILYLAQHGEDVRGGETGIADEVVDTPGGGTAVTAGLRVEPSIGRLLVFSSGVENMHEMLPVTQGKRVAVQMWFACEGMDPGWAHPQRVAWEAEHGWGGPQGSAPPAPPNTRELPKAWSWR
jgi:hypothetical protein